LKNKTENKNQKTNMDKIEICKKKEKELRRKELFWILGVYLFFLILIAIATGLLAIHTETKESEYITLIFFSCLTLIVTSFTAYYFCCIYFAPSSLTQL
jgi:uncharacterized membrane protein (DUF485 family)